MSETYKHTRHSYSLNERKLLHAGLLHKNTSPFSSTVMINRLADNSRNFAIDLDRVLFIFIQ